MDAALAVGFAAVSASLLAIALLVFASRRIIEKTHRENLAASQGSVPGSEDNGNHGDAS
jgi:acetyl-CoA carboxylase beta subunit